MGNTKKTKTAIYDLLEWIDRVEERGINTLSTDKVRERIKERIPMEKERMLKMAMEARELIVPAHDLFNDKFIQTPEK